MPKQKINKQKLLNQGYKEYNEFWIGLAMLGGTFIVGIIAGVILSETLF